MRRTLLGWPFQVALSLGLVLWLVSDLDWEGLRSTLLGADRLLAAAAFTALAPIPLLAAERWRSACAALGLHLPRNFFIPAAYAAVRSDRYLVASSG